MLPLSYFIEARGPMCEICGERPAEHRHHALYGRAKRYPELNDERNIQIVCVVCHLYTGAADTWDNRMNFWLVQCDRYGKADMIAWHEGLPMKVKERAYC